MINVDRVAINPLQYVATEDGWINPTLAPPLDEQLSVIAANGFRYVHCAVPADSTPADYVRTLAAHGLRPGPGYLNLRWSNDAAERAQAIERVRAVAAETAEAGSDVAFLSLAMGAQAPRVSRAAAGVDFDETRFQGVIAHLTDAAEVARSEGLIPALHPHVGSWLETEQETRRVLESIPSSLLAFGPDTGHLTWAGADVAQLLSDYADRVVGIHIKDYDDAVATEGRETARDYRTTVQRGLWREPGTGDADLDGIYDALGPRFTGWTVIEVDRGFISPPAQSIAACGEWLQAQRRRDLAAATE